MGQDSISPKGGKMKAKATETKKPRYKGFIRNGDILHGPIQIRERMFSFKGKQRRVISLLLPSGAELEFGIKIDETQVIQYLGELVEPNSTRKQREFA